MNVPICPVLLKPITKEGRRSPYDGSMERIDSILDLLERIDAAWSPDTRGRPFTGRADDTHAFTVNRGMQDHDIRCARIGGGDLMMTISKFASDTRPEIVNVDGAGNGPEADAYAPAPPDATAKEAVSRMRRLAGILRGLHDEGLRTRTSRDLNPVFDLTERVATAAAASASIRLGIPITAQTRGPLSIATISAHDVMGRTMLDAVDDAELRLMTMEPTLIIDASDRILPIEFSPFKVRIDATRHTSIELLRMIEEGLR